MVHLRQFIRTRRSSAVLSAFLAYALALQALMASVGIGMSVFATPGQAGFVICSHAAVGAPAAGREGQKSPSTPECPFCLVAAQCSGHMAFADGASAFPAYVAVLVAKITDPICDGAFVPQFRRLAGGPRAPPIFSA
jgi:hypothetical protein